MFGLISKKENKQRVDELQRLLSREKAKSTYWKCRCLNPDKEPLIIGSKEDIEYITSKEYIQTKSCADRPPLPTPPVPIKVKETFFRMKH